MDGWNTIASFWGPAQFFGAASPHYPTSQATEIPGNGKHRFTSDDEAEANVQKKKTIFSEKTVFFLWGDVWYDIMENIHL